MKNEKITIGIIALLIVLFSYTSVSKVLEYEKFVFQLRLSPWGILKQMAAWIGVALPLLEAGIVIALLYSKTIRLGLWASLGLLASFEIYIIVMLLSGLNLPCTCGGFISHMTWTQHLWFNGLFIVLTGLAILQTKNDRANKNIKKGFSRV
ncbi:MAG: hypothetical protein JST58_09585 [Bacteroidetes bacterium]|nr:hypothetical protein [Bacteroidota bacterium]